MNETATAALQYRFENLEREAKDLRKRLTLALAEVETLKARANKECELRMEAELKMEAMRSRM